MWACVCVVCLNSRNSTYSMNIVCLKTKKNVFLLSFTVKLSIRKLYCSMQTQKIHLIDLSIYMRAERVESRVGLNWIESVRTNTCSYDKLLCVFRCCCFVHAAHCFCCFFLNVILLFVTRYSYAVCFVRTYIARIFHSMPHTAL